MSETLIQFLLLPDKAFEQVTLGNTDKANYSILEEQFILIKIALCIHLIFYDLSPQTFVSNNFIILL